MLFAEEKEINIGGDQPGQCSKTEVVKRKLTDSLTGNVAILASKEEKTAEKR